MEKFNHKEYRDDLADKLKDIKDKEDRKDFLDDAKLKEKAVKNNFLYGPTIDIENEKEIQIEHTKGVDFLSSEGTYNPYETAKAIHKKEIENKE